LQQLPQARTYASPKATQSLNLGRKWRGFRAKRFIFSGRNSYLEEHHPEHFGEVQEKYDGQLEDIGKKIAELEQADA
jgi:hypothetical protein